MRSSPVAIEVEHAGAKVTLDMCAASRTRLGRVNEAVLQLDVHPPRDLRASARALHADRVPKREIARHVGRDPATIRRWLRPDRPRCRGKPRTPALRAHLIDAGLAWDKRVGALPNSSSWHATRAQRKGGAEYQRFLEGWGPPGQRAWRSWPQPHDVNRRFKSWATFKRVLEDELERRRIEAEPYRPRHPPADRVRFAAILTYSASVLELARNPGRVIRVSIEPEFIQTPEGYLDLRADTDRRDVAIVGEPGTGRSAILAGVVALDRFREQRVVVVQRERAALIASGLPMSALTDLKEAVRFERGAVVCSDDPEVRMIAVEVAVRVSVELDRHVCIAVDDADDLVVNLARMMRHKPATAHVAVVWTPQLSETDVFLWVAQPVRVNLGISDPSVDEVFRRKVDPALRREGLGLPPEGMT